MAGPVMRPALFSSLLLQPETERTNAMNYGWYIRRQSDGKFLRRGVDDVAFVGATIDATRFDSIGAACAFYVEHSHGHDTFPFCEVVDYMLPEPTPDIDPPPPIRTEAEVIADHLAIARARREATRGTEELRSTPPRAERQPTLRKGYGVGRY